VAAVPVVPMWFALAVVAGPTALLLGTLLLAVWLFAG
jgi:VIT1/CCC1 family predicted Fe2+/Mn2+ transporter